jgi:hypothetical protein
VHFLPPPVRTKRLAHLTLSGLITPMIVPFRTVQMMILLYTPRFLLSLFHCSGVLPTVHVAVVTADEYEQRTKELIEIHLEVTYSLCAFSNQSTNLHINLSIHNHEAR